MSAPRDFHEVPRCSQNLPRGVHKDPQRGPGALSAAKKRPKGHQERPKRHHKLSERAPGRRPVP